MGTGDDFQRPVIPGDLVNHQKGSDQVVVGMWCEQEDLVPFHLGIATRQLGINFGMMKLDVGANEVGNTIGHPARGHRFKIGIGYFYRSVDTPKTRFAIAVSGFEVEPGAPIERFTIGLAVPTALFDPGAEIIFHCLQQLLINGIFDQQIAIFPELLPLLVA